MRVNGWAATTEADDHPEIALPMTIFPFRQRAHPLKARRPPLLPHRQPIQWADDTHGASIQHVGIDHRGLDVRVAQQLLHGTDVLPRFQQVGSEGMAQHMSRESQKPRRD